MNEDVQLTNTVEQTRLFQWFMKFSCVARAATLWPPAYRSRTRVVTFESRGPSGEKLRTGFERIESCWVASRPYTHTYTHTQHIHTRARVHGSLRLSQFPSYALGPTINRCIPIQNLYLEKNVENLKFFQVKNSSVSYSFLPGKLNQSLEI